MAREKKVVDASIVVKWFAQEPDSPAALRLRDQHISGEILLIAPELIFLEVLNALRYKKGNDARALAEANDLLWQTQIHIEKTNQQTIEKAVFAAIKYNLTIYDALYVVMAQLHGIPLITADAALSKAPNTVLLQ